MKDFTSSPVIVLRFREKRWGRENCKGDRRQTQQE